MKCVGSIWPLPKSLKTPPLSNGQTWKKSVPNHSGKPLHPRANLCKKMLQTIIASLYTSPIFRKRGYILGMGSSFLKCVGCIWALPKSLKSPPPSLSNGQTWKKVFQTILASPYIPGHTLVKKSTANHLGKPKTPPQ